MSIELKGAAELRQTLRRVVREMPKEASRALFEEALIETKESQKRTPVDTGALRASHETGRPVMSGQDISVTISVGGPAAPYALVVHERLEAFHKVGQAKFLESTIMESRPFMAARVARRIDLNRIVK